MLRVWPAGIASDLGSIVVQLQEPLMSSTATSRFPWFVSGTIQWNFVVSHTSPKYKCDSGTKMGLSGASATAGANDERLAAR
jgi:hypothetical protein